MPFRLQNPVLTLAMAALLAACADASVQFPVTKSAQDALAEDVAIVRLGPDNIHNFGFNGAGHTATSLPPHQPSEYKIGPSDVISIFVFNQPELAIPAGQDEVTTGYLVQTDGTLAFPFIGSVNASGRTVDSLRKELGERLAAFFPDPQVDVRIVGFNSQRVVVGGEVGSPTTQYIRTTPLTLLEAINGAGGLDEEADPRNITVRRDGKPYTVDLEAFLMGKMAGNNPYLKGGDVVSVPRKAVREAYLLGEIVDPATVDMSSDPVTLTQALTKQGGLNELRADARGVFVFRSVGGTMTVYQLDVSTPTALLLGTRFALKPMDVVYVTKSPLQRWNDTISRVLPTVTAARTVREF